MATEYDQITDAVDGTIRLPIGSKVYTVPAHDWDTGEAITRTMNMGMRLIRGVGLNATLLSDEEEDPFYRLCLGAAFDQMRADHVPYAAMKHAALTVAFQVAAGEESARLFWQGGAGKALASTTTPTVDRPGATTATTSAPPDAAGTAS